MAHTAVARALGAQQQVVLTSEGLEAVHGELLVRFRDEKRAAATQVHTLLGASVQQGFRSVPGLQLVALPEDTSLEEALAVYRKSPDVLYAEPNYLWHLDATVPNDPSFGQLWALNNDGDGSGDVDINAPEAWDVTVGSDETVVAVIDSGVNYRHEDLAESMWVNPGEVPGNGVDDDANGYVDDVHGINAITNTGDPMDDNQHGSHVAGTIAARGNNGRGITGVAWRTKVVGCKFATATGSGATANAVKCLDYVYDLRTRTTHPVNLVASNNSWGGGAYSQALQDAIGRHLSAGMLFIASAGNNGRDNDVTAHYPGSYPLPNVISVAATDRTDSRSVFASGASSNYGRRRVHVAAPGSDIYSTLLGQTYGALSGTSMATPHVTGLVALLNAQTPSRDWRALKNLVLAGGQDVDGLRPQILTGKRIRAWNTGGTTSRRGSLTCINQRVTTRWLPAADPSIVLVGTRVEVVVLNINCGQPGGNLTATLSSGGTLTLLDDGQGADRAAGDGLYSAFWQPPGAGTYTLTLPNAETFRVTALEAYRPAALPTAEWRSITGTPLNLADGSSAQVSTPFPIRFGGHSGFTTAWVNSEGHLSFTNDVLTTNNARLPVGLFQTLVAPYWDSLHTADSAVPPGNVFHEVLGAAPNREWVIEWRNIGHSSLSEDVPYPSITFQAVFRENSSEVRFNYLDVDFTGTGAGQYDRGRSATAGVQVTSADASLYVNNAARLDNNMSLLFLTSAPPVLGDMVASPATATEGQTLAFSSLFTDADGAADGSWTVEWDFNYGGLQFNVEDSQVATVEGSIAATRAFAQSGRYVVAARVKDKDGVVSAVRTVVVDVGNEPPVASTPVLNVASAPEGQSVTLTSSFSDVGPDAPWRVEWDFDYDGTTFRADLIQRQTSQGPISLEHTFRQDGTYRVAMRVVDRDNTPSEVRETQVTVVDVQPRLGAIVAEASVQEGAPYTLRTTFADPGDGASPWRAEFDLDYDGTTFQADRQGVYTAPGEVSLTESFPQQGPRRVAVRLVDADGSVSPLVETALAVQDVSPLVLSATALPAGGSEPRTVEFNVVAESGASPASVDPVSYYHWDFDGDGAVDLVGLSSRAVYRYLDNPVGGDTWQARVWVEDEDSRTEHVLPVQVANVPPVLAAVAPEHAAREGTAFRLQLVATDPGGLHDPLTWELTQAPEGMVVSPLGVVQWLPALEQTSGAGAEHTVVVRVTDDDGASASATFSVRATWKDVDEDGMPDTWERARGLDPTRNDAAEDADGDGVSNLDESRDANGGPRLPGAVRALRPAEGAMVRTAGVELEVENAVDTDSDSLAYAFAVYEDEALTQVVATATAGAGASGRTAVQLDGAKLADGKVYWWRARASDGALQGPWGAARRFTYNPVNGLPAAPLAVAPVAGTRTVEARPTLTVLNARDPDGDALTYEFEVRAGSPEGEVVAQGQVPEGEGGTRFTVEQALKAGTYVWRARAVDSQGAQGPWSEPLRFQVEQEAQGCSAAGGGPQGLLLLPALLAGLRLRRRRQG